MLVLMNIRNRMCNIQQNKCNIMHERSDEEPLLHVISGRKMTTFLAQTSLDPMRITIRPQRICVNLIHEDECP